MSELPVVYRFPCDYVPEQRRQYQLTQALARHRPVFFVADAPITSSRSLPQNAAGTRAVAYELTSIGSVTVLRRHTTHTFHRCCRYAPAMARTMDSVALKSALRRAGIVDCVLMLPGREASFFPPRWVRRLALDLQDPPIDNEHVWWSQCADLARRCALVCVTATALQDELATRGVASTLVLNAGPKPNRSGPRGTGSYVLYVGTIDDRVDVPIIAEVARRLPDQRFIIAGRVNPPHDRLAAVRSIHNVEILGTVTESKKIDLIEGAATAFIPFRMDRVGDAINPTKVYEFAAHGLPVVATDTRACREIPAVTTGSTADQLAAHIAVAGSQPKPSPELQRFASMNTWAERATVIHSLLP